ncbi:hypothetical protein [Streptomyces turgidiscabies]|uniref:Uncharacterized protein n=1 Tax=Streptomyces turgidiscabies TaxID=85558 RepID=A0ABU0RQU3_9ACTN|nr:hypothetical protein [Streptomyces turgidiscabies]MDQ0933315.1 hypothetical protein [Streptomyces turgidiscabies]
MFEPVPYKALKPVGQPTRLRGFPKTFALVGGLVAAAQAPSYVEEYGVGRGSWEMFKDIVDPFGVHKAVEPPAAGGSVCPPTNCA